MIEQDVLMVSAMRLVCRYCKNWVTKEEDVGTQAYWHLKVSEPYIPQGVWKDYLCYVECKKEGEAEEAFLCQTIDADCNDCKWFKRGEMSGRHSFKGHCMKFDKPTIAHPKMATAHSCFEHRKMEEAKEKGWK